MRFDQKSGLWLPSPSGRVVKSRSLTSGTRHGRLVVHSAPFGHGRKGGGGGSLAGIDPYLGQPVNLFEQASVLMASRRRAPSLVQTAPQLDTTPAGLWTLEPVGFSVLADTAWNQAIPTGGTDQSIPNLSPWHIVGNGTDPTDTTSGAYQITDSSAPLDAGACLRFRYRNGMSAGGAPATLYFGPGAVYRYIFYGWYFKTSDPWQNASSNTRKLMFTQTSSAGTPDMYLRMKSSDGGSINWVLDVVVEGFPDGTVPYASNINNPLVTLNVWHKIQWLMKWSTDASTADGIIKWSLDDVLLGSYTNVKYPADHLAQVDMSPTLGGTGGSISETDTLDYNHFHVSQGG